MFTSLYVCVEDLLYVEKSIVTPDLKRQTLKVPLNEGKIKGII